MLSANQCQLVLVDVQGRLARLMHEVDGMVRAQRILIQGCRLLDIPIVWAEQLPQKLGPTIDELQPHLSGLTATEKSHFGCWDAPSTRAAIEANQRQQLIVCGIETHVCVWQTASAFAQQGFEVHVAADACSSRSVSHHALALQRMCAEGIHLSSSEMVLFECMNRADHPQFRAVTALLK
ncbi:MAG: hydrolase [Pseudomonadota bacterium]